MLFYLFSFIVKNDNTLVYYSLLYREVRYAENGVN